jgi:predicted RNA-binding Zn ribbon-like protein
VRRYTLGMSAATEFRFDGGATWLNLLATRGQSFGPRPVERLPSPAAAQKWLTLVGLEPPGVVSDAELDRLLELREAMRNLAMASVEGGAPSPGALAEVSSAARVLAAHSMPDVLNNRHVQVDAASGILAVQALVTLRGPDRHLLKECGEADCRWVFLDTSGRRHWCPAPACASRGRVRALRARQAARQ